jgi:DNA topoisomerase I
VRDPETLARIRRLAIPPAWQDVWICPRDDGHLQATGRDARGRKQYRYHPRWREVRDETKYARMLAFGHALPRVRRRVARDLRRAGLPREKVLAALVRLLETTFIRIGNEEYARANESFGLTTLRGRQVRVRGARLDFSFRGKSGVRHEVALTDRRLAAIVRRMQDLPGEELFQYVDEAGETRAIGSADVNDYLREITGEGFTSKDFRTWAGTLLCAQALARLEAPASQAAARREIVHAVAGAAQALRNTPAVCRTCYIHPVVLERYAAGRLRAEMRGTSAEGALIALLREAERGEASGRRSRRKLPCARPGSWRRGPRPSSGVPGSRAPLFAPQP